MSARETLGVEEEGADQETPDTQPEPTSGISGCGSLGCGTLFLLGLFGLPLLHMWGGTWEGGEMMLLPLFIGAPAFLVGNVFAIVAVNSKSNRESTLGLIALVLLWGPVFLACLLSWIAGAVAQQ